MAVGPADVAGDRGFLCGVGGVVAAVEGEVAQCGELRLDPVQPRGVGRGEHLLDIVVGAPVCDLGLAMRGEVVADGVKPSGREPSPELTEEGEELLPALAVS